jgi:hypothetical protein
MATTTNYGWETPDDTDLVKDGAAAIRTLGSSVDTTTKALNPSTTLGDIEYRSATANTNTRLGIGTSGQVLSVSAGVPSWTTPAGGGGMTLLSTTSLSGAANVSLTGTLTGYNNLQIVVRNPQVASGGQYVGFRLNSDTGSNYAYGFDTFASSNLTYFDGAGTSIVPQQNSISGNTANLVFVFDVYDINGTSSFKAVRLHTYEVGFGSGTARIQHGAAAWRNAGAVTSVSVQNIAATNWTSGDVLLYGVK